MRKCQRWCAPFGALSAALVAALCTALVVVPAPALAQLDVTVDLSKRQMTVRQDGEVVGRYPVAVGRPSHRTPTGSYSLSRVVWNPAWTPPPGVKWAAKRHPERPNSPGNPMGNVKIYFANLYFIHGTKDTRSLGAPASHGCIRMSNSDAENLARLVMENGGAGHSEEWYAKARRDDSTSEWVSIPRPPVLHVTP